MHRDKDMSAFIAELAAEGEDDDEGFGDDDGDDDVEDIEDYDDFEYEYEDDGNP